MTKLRIFLFVVFIIIVAVLIVFPYRNKAAVTVAFLGNLSGNGSQEDFSACNGARLAVESINSRGGIKGRQLELVIYDLKGRAEMSAQICRGMKQKKTGFLLAPYLSDAALRPCIVQEQILTLSAGLEEGKKPGADMGVALYFLARDYGSALAELVLAQDNTRVTVLNDIAYYPFGLAFLEGFRKPFLERGGEIPAELTFDTRRGKPAEELVEKAAGSRPDSILLVASAKTTGRLGRRLRKQNPKTVLYAAPWAMTKSLDASIVLEGLSAYGGEAVKSRQAGWKSFSSTYEARYNVSPDLSALFGYEALLVLAEGIRNSASPDPFLVKHTLVKMTRFQGLVSDYTLSFGDGLKEKYFLFEVRGGALTRQD